MPHNVLPASSIKFQPFRVHAHLWYFTCLVSNSYYMSICHVIESHEENENYYDLVMLYLHCHYDYLAYSTHDDYSSIITKYGFVCILSPLMIRMCPQNYNCWSRISWPNHIICIYRHIYIYIFFFVLMIWCYANSQTLI